MPQHRVFRGQVPVRDFFPVQCLESKPENRGVPHNLLIVIEQGLIRWRALLRHNLFRAVSLLPSPPSLFRLGVCHGEMKTSSRSSWRGDRRGT